MNKSRLLTLGLTVLLAFAIAAMAQPQPAPTPAGAPGKFMMGQMLNLTPEQQEQIAALRLELQKKNLPLRSKLNDYRAEIKLLVVSDNYSRSKVESLISKINDVRKQLMLNRIEFQRKVRNLLTPEQRTRFDARILSGKGMHGKPGRPSPGMHKGCAPGMHHPPHHRRW